MIILEYKTRVKHNGENEKAHNFKNKLINEFMNSKYPSSKGKLDTKMFDISKNMKRMIQFLSFKSFNPEDAEQNIRLTNYQGLLTQGYLSLDSIKIIFNDIVKELAE